LFVPENTNNQFSIEKSIHTKKNINIWICKLTEKVSKEEFKQILEDIKDKGGYYSRFVKGFVFEFDPTNILNNEVNETITETETQHQEEILTIEEVAAVEEVEEKINFENVEVKDISNQDIFVKALEPALNKNCNIKLNNECIDEKAYLNKYKITDIITLSEKQYNYFINHLLDDYDFLTSKGGWEEDENGNFLYNYAVAIVCQDKETLIIDPSGSSYARYTNRLIEDINGNLQNEINITVKANTESYNNRIDLIEDKELYKVDVNKETIIKDNRYILNDYVGVTAVTGYALKELIYECKGIVTDFKQIQIKQQMEYFLEGILKVESGQVIELFSNTRSETKHIKFSERLQHELKRIDQYNSNEIIAPEEVEIIEVEAMEIIEPIKSISNNNIIDVEVIEEVENDKMEITEVAKAMQEIEFVLWSLKVNDQLKPGEVEAAHKKAQNIIEKYLVPNNAVSY